MTEIIEHTGLIGFLIKTGHFMDRVERAIKGPAPIIPCPIAKQLRHDIEHMSDWARDIKALERPRIQPHPTAQPTTAKVERIIPMIIVVPDITINPTLTYGNIPKSPPYSVPNLDMVFHKDHSVWLNKDITQTTRGSPPPLTEKQRAAEKRTEKIILLVIKLFKVYVFLKSITEKISLLAIILFKVFVFLKSMVETPKTKKRFKYEPLLIKDLPRVNLPDIPLPPPFTIANVA
ncbi:MAG: hypothetical protein KDK50_02635 [Chlamydiia bacterium]|nr:hypothetical protein [Chlamydiia bacterium]